jgi:replicative DNA helicase Mcm
MKRDDIREKVSIETVLQYYGVKLVERGNTECPFHNSHMKQSFHVYSDEKRCHCFASGCVSGDIFDVVAFAEKMDVYTDYPYVAKKVCEIGNIEYIGEKPDPLREDKSKLLKKVYEYSLKGKHRIKEYVMEKRKINEDIFNSLHIGYLSIDNIKSIVNAYKTKLPDFSEKVNINNLFILADRIIHPHFDISGNSILTLTGEATPNTKKAPKEEKLPKYKKLAGSLSVTGKTELYLLPNLKNDGDIIWTEGFWDALQMDLHKVNTISFGTSKISQTVIDNYYYYMKNKKIVICFDDEENNEGRKGAISLANRLLKKGCENVTIYFLDRENKGKIDIDELVHNKTTQEVQEISAKMFKSAIPFEEYLLSQFSSDTDLDIKIEGLVEYYSQVSDVTKNRIEGVIKNTDIPGIQLWDIFQKKLENTVIESDTPETELRKEEFKQVINAIETHAKSCKTIEDLQQKVFIEMKNAKYWNSKPMQYRETTFKNAVDRLSTQWQNTMDELFFSDDENVVSKTLFTYYELHNFELTNELTSQKSRDNSESVPSDLSTKLEKGYTSIENKLLKFGIIPNQNIDFARILLAKLEHLKRNEKNKKLSVKKHKNHGNYVNCVNLQLCNLLSVTSSNNKYLDHFYYSYFVYIFHLFCNYFDIKLTELSDLTKLTELTQLTNKKEIEMLYFSYIGLFGHTNKELIIAFKKLGITYEKSSMSRKIKRETAGKTTGLLEDGIYEQGYEYQKTIYYTSINGFRQATQLLLSILNEDLQKYVEFEEKKREEEEKESIVENIQQFIQEHSEKYELQAYNGMNYELFISYANLKKHMPKLATKFLTDADDVLETIKRAVPSEVLSANQRKIGVSIYDLPKSQEVSIGYISDKHIEKPIKITGRVVMASQNRFEASHMKFECPSCGTIMSLSQTREDDVLQEPKKCYSCGYKGKFTEIDSDYRTFQTIKVQERSEDMADRSSARDITIYISGSWTEKEHQFMFNPGNDVIIEGIVRKIFNKKNNKKNREVRLYLEASYCSTDKSKKDFTVTPEDEKQIWELRDRYEKDIIHIVSQNISHQIVGMEDIKLGLACCLVNAGSGKHITHTLIIGDPSAGKSIVSEDAIRFVQNPSWVSGKSSSDVGLTASVIRDELSGQWSLRAGALPLSNNSISNLDELDKMPDKNALLEPMEKKTVTVNKAGVNGSLSAATGIIATANPKYGRFQEGRKILDQINLDSFLVSRFDLLFAIKNDTSQLGNIISSVVDVMVDVEDDEMELSYEKIDEELLRKYFSYARNIKPVGTKELKQHMKTFIAESFQEYSNVDGRVARSIPKLMYAIAKLRLHQTILVEDLEEAVRLKKASLDSYLVEKDIDEFTTGVTDTDRTIIDTLFKLIKTQDSVSLTDFRELLAGSVTDDQLQNALNSLKSSGDIVENKKEEFSIPVKTEK